MPPQLLLLVATVGLVQLPPADSPAPSLNTIISAAESPDWTPQDVRLPVEGLVVWIARTTMMPVGLELDRDLPEARVLAPADLDTLTIRAALDAIVRVDPRYEWKDIGGVPVVRPRTAWRDARNPLNRPLAVHWTDDHPALLLDRVREVLYGYSADEAMGDAFDSRRMSIDIRAGTLLDVLSAIVGHGDLTWSVAYGGAGRWRYSIGLHHIQSGGGGGGIAHSFPKPPPAR